jgi:hypothetical protein
MYGEWRQTTRQGENAERNPTDPRDDQHITAAAISSNRGRIAPFTRDKPDLYNDPRLIKYRQRDVWGIDGYTSE